MRPDARLRLDQRRLPKLRARHSWTKPSGSERWQSRDIGFHQPHVHEQLKQLWPSLDLASWKHCFRAARRQKPRHDLARDARPSRHRRRAVGHRRSRILYGRRTDARRSSEGTFRGFFRGTVQLYCGDFFDLRPEALNDVAAVYDRAALIALPADAQSLRRDAGERSFHATPLFSSSPSTIPSMRLPDRHSRSRGEEIERLFGETFNIDVLEARDGLAASANLQKARRHPAGGDRPICSGGDGMKPLVLVAAVALIDDDKRVLIAKRPRASRWRALGVSRRQGRGRRNAGGRALPRDQGRTRHRALPYVPGAIQFRQPRLRRFPSADAALYVPNLGRRDHAARRPDHRMGARDASLALPDAAGGRTAHSLVEGFFGLGFRTSARRTCADRAPNGFCWLSCGTHPVSVMISNVAGMRPSGRPNRS